MKKSFFGYDTEEIDELIDSLQNQNDILTEKIAKLTMRLSTAESSVNDNGEIEEIANKNNELEKSLVALEQQIAKTKDKERATREQLEQQIEQERKKYEEAFKSEKSLNEQLDKVLEENKALRIENSEINNKLNSLDGTNAKNDVDNKIGTLFNVTYKNCENIQREVIEDMRLRVSSYETIISSYNSQMKQAVNNTKNLYKNMMSQFSEQLDLIFNGLSVIELGNRKIEESLDKPEKIAQDLNDKIEKIISENSNALAKLNIENKEQKENEDRIIPVSPLLKIKDKYFKELANDK